MQKYVISHKSQRIVGFLILIYVVMYTYLYIIDSMIANYFALTIFAGAYIDSILLKRKKIHINMPVLFYLLFLFLSMLSFFWTVSEEAYIDALPRNLFFMIMTISIYNILFWYDVKKYLLWGIVVGGIINFAVYCNLLPFPLPVFEGQTRFSGTLGNSNEMGVFISFSIFATTLLVNFFKNSRFSKVILFVYTPLSFYLLFQTGSRTSILFGYSFLILFFVSYVKTKKGLLYLGTLSLVMLVGFNYLMQDDEFANQLRFVSERFEGARETIEGRASEGSTQQRLYFIKEGIKLWKDRPFLGYGNRSYSYLWGTYAHNNYVEILVNTGVFGFVLFYLFYLFTIVSVSKLNNRNLKIHGLFFLFASLALIEFGRVYNMNAIYIIIIIMLSTLHSGKESTPEVLGCDVK